MVQVYDHPLSPANHEAVSAAKMVYGIVKGGRVVKFVQLPQAAATQ